MKNLLVTILAIIFISLATQAQGSSSGVGETIEDTEHGYSFTAPADWSAEKSKGKDAGVILANPAGTINIVVKPHHSNSLANFFKNESNLSGQGFKQSGEVKELADGMKYVRVTNSTNEADILLDIIFVPVSADGGVVVMNFTPTGSLAEEAMKYAVNIVKSFRFSTPRSSGPSSPASPSPAPSNSTSYYSLFAGKRYYYENPRSGYQDRIDFCSSGTFTRTEVTSYGMDETTGRWTVQQSGGTVNLVATSGGEQKAFLVSKGRQGGSIILDGREYDVSNGGCR